MGILLGNGLLLSPQKLKWGFLGHWGHSVSQMGFVTIIWYNDCHNRNLFHVSKMSQFKDLLIFLSPILMFWSLWHELEDAYLKNLIKIRYPLFTFRIKYHFSLIFRTKHHFPSIQCTIIAYLLRARHHVRLWRYRDGQLGFLLRLGARRQSGKDRNKDVMRSCGSNGRRAWFCLSRSRRRVRPTQWWCHWWG